MSPVIRMIDSFIAASTDVASLAFLMVFIIFFTTLTIRAKNGRGVAVRPIRAYERVRRLVSQSTESGQPIHVSLGSGQVGAEATPEVLMGLTVFDYVARHAAASGQAVGATTGDPTVLAAAQGVLYAARRDAGCAERYAGYDVAFSGPDPFAYACGAAAAIGERQLANFLVGRFGAEGLWLAEAARRGNVPQLGGTASPVAFATLYPALDDAVIGEDLFAAGAYLHRPSHLGSLAAQDLARVLVLLAIVVGVILSSLGYWR